MEKKKVTTILHIRDEILFPEGISFSQGEPVLNCFYHIKRGDI